MTYTVTRTSRTGNCVKKLALTGTIPEIAGYFGKRYRTYDGMKKSMLKDEKENNVTYCIAAVSSN